VKCNRVKIKSNNNDNNNAGNKILSAVQFCRFFGSKRFGWLLLESSLFEFVSLFFFSFLFFVSHSSLFGFCGRLTLGNFLGRRLILGAEKRKRGRRRKGGKEEEEGLREKEEKETK